jgi:hypothetical protein
MKEEGRTQSTSSIIARVGSEFPHVVRAVA